MTSALLIQSFCFYITDRKSRQIVIPLVPFYKLMSHEVPKSTHAKIGSRARLLGNGGDDVGPPSEIGSWTELTISFD